MSFVSEDDLWPLCDFSCELELSLFSHELRVCAEFSVENVM